MTKRVALIGAGPSGLALLRAFQSAKTTTTTTTSSQEGQQQEIPEIVCFEKQSNWGGLWNISSSLSWLSGIDEHGEVVHSGMYRHLWSNGPKEGLEFADYTFEEHFGKAVPSYPPRAVLADYLTGRATKTAGARECVRFCTPVRMVKFDEISKTFTVTAHDLKRNHVYEEQFDYVVVATGHFSTPNLPHFEGLDTFPGRVLHSHDFRDALEFRDQDVLIIGRSYSAEDVGLQCYKFGAKSITTSYRTCPMGFKWPSNWKEVPLLEKVVNKTCFFRDGSSRDVDAIILCTGYVYHLPFLPDSLRLTTENRLWPLGLYKGVVWESNPQLFYLGMQDQFYTFSMFDCQAWFVRDVILGKIELPSLEEMRAHSAAWRAREEKLETDEQRIWFQGDYVEELMNDSDYPHHDIKKVNQTFLEWEHHKMEDILGYRNHCHRSVMTGTMSPPHHTPWLLAMDDSLEGFLQIISETTNNAVVQTIMKAHVYLGNGETSWEDRPVPSLQDPTDAIVRIKKTTICGTDLNILRGSVATCVPGRILGHEGIATIEEIGSKVSRYKKGDQVLISCITSCGSCANCKRNFFAHCETGGWLLGNTIDGCQAEFVRIPHADYSLYPFPDGVEEGAAVMLSDILPSGLEVGVLDGKLSEGQTLAIVGVGPVGLAALMSAVLRKPKWIIAIDIDENRLNVARSIGATHCINNTDGSAVRQIQELTIGKGVDLAIEAIGLPVGWDICEDIVASGGNIALLGVHGKSVTLHLERMWYRNFSLTAGLVNTYTIPILVDAVLSKQIDPTLLISHRIKLSEVKRGYEIFANAAENHSLKVVLEA